MEGVVEGEGGGRKGGGETTAGARPRPSSITGRYVTIAIWNEKTEECYTILSYKAAALNSTRLR